MARVSLVAQQTGTGAKMLVLEHDSPLALTEVLTSFFCSLFLSFTADTPFEDGTFKLLMTFDESYPNKPPTVKFLSRMFHPNVYASGELCLDILQNRWSPTYDVSAILTSVQSLLNDPNSASPANVEAASLWKENRREYVKRVKKTVEESWMDDGEDMKLEEMDEDEGEDGEEAAGGGAAATTS